MDLVWHMYPCHMFNNSFLHHGIEKAANQNTTTQSCCTVYSDGIKHNLPTICHIDCVVHVIFYDMHGVE